MSRISDTLPRKTIIALLFKLARIDGKLTDQEVQFIFDTAKRLGLTSGEVELIQYQPEQYPLDPPTREVDRMTILYNLLFLMKIDHQISSEEEDMVLGVAIRLGIRPELAKELIQVMHTYAKRKIPAHEMLDRVRKYMN